MLVEPIALHRPGCDGRHCQGDDDCVQDMEDFARSVLNDHIAGGARRRNGTLTGPAPMSMADYDDCLTDLFGACWIAAQRFNPIDDGRGSNRLAGYLAWKLHKEIIDWKRRRWKSTRYLTTPIIETPYDDELSAAIHHDEEPIGIDPSTLTHQAQHAYRKVCGPLAESGLEPAEFALRTSQSLSWVMQALRIVKVELEQQGIRPSTMQEGSDDEQERRDPSAQAAA
jgi:hypothetical protein